MDSVQRGFPEGRKSRLVPFPTMTKETFLLIMSGFSGTKPAQARLTVS